ncbi:MAG: hypothetical protein M9916_13180 [Crocinitomicaceae bacterium]|nr:hypothetical protein [Crocinitomicaceae bacterium]
MAFLLFSYQQFNPLNGLILISLTFPVFGQTDTVFIEKDSLYGTAQSIFFDNNPDSKFYDKINYWSFLTFDNESYKYSIDFLKEYKLTLTKETPIIPQTKWVTLKQYKGAFYVYKPSDFLFHYRISINDTTFIDWMDEGPEANKIITQKKIDKNTFEFQLTGVTKKDRKLTIHIIDSKKGIAVFEEVNDNEYEHYYYLMIASEKIRTAPLIVNNSIFQKQFELEFDKPNYSELLKRKN